MLIAAGGEPRKLDVPGEGELAGGGVLYCAIRDGPLLQDQTIAVVGGGNTAVEEADYLTRFASVSSPSRASSSSSASRRTGSRNTQRTMPSASS